MFTESQCAEAGIESTPCAVTVSLPDPAPDIPATTCGPFVLEPCLSDHPRRAEAEAFVRSAFHRSHGARIESFMPTLLMLTDAQGALCGVTGCRVADAGPLFLERYLHAPIEQVLEGVSGARISRSGVVEIGNFACRSSSVARVLMSRLPRYLLEQKLSWIAFTATSSVRRILRHLGARPTELALAEGACVNGGPDDWGRYYSHDPRVMAGFLPAAKRIPALWAGCHEN